jgi:cytochrome b
MSSRALVWDPFVRLFHWSLVALFGFAWWSGREGLMWMDWHMLAGEAIIALILFRVLWGLFGPRTARFSDFLRGPRAVLRELADLAGGRAHGHVGHGAAGGWMVVLLLVLVFVESVSGLFASDDLFTSGPLTHWVAADTEGFLTWLHNDLFEWLKWLVGLHVAVVVVVYPLLTRADLVRPMVTGYKRTSAAGVALTRGVWLRGGVLLAASAALVTAVIRWG